MVQLVEKVIEHDVQGPVDETASRLVLADVDVEPFLEVAHSWGCQLGCQMRLRAGSGDPEAPFFLAKNGEPPRNRTGNLQIKSLERDRK